MYNNHANHVILQSWFRQLIRGVGAPRPQGGELYRFFVSLRMTDVLNQGQVTTYHYTALQIDLAVGHKRILILNYQLSLFN